MSFLCFLFNRNSVIDLIKCRSIYQITSQDDMSVFHIKSHKKDMSSIKNHFIVDIACVWECPKDMRYSSLYHLNSVYSIRPLAPMDFYCTILAPRITFTFPYAVYYKINIPKIKCWTKKTTPAVHKFRYWTASTHANSL